MAENADVQLLSLPLEFTEDDVKKFVMEAINIPADQIFNGVIYIGHDTRPPEVNSNGSFAIFTCQSVDMAKRVVEEVNKVSRIFDGLKESTTIRAKLTRGMLAYTKTVQAQSNKERFSDSGKNIQVFNLQKGVTEEQVRAFFSKYGEIEVISKPNRTDVEENIFHFNILFFKQEDAERAIREAT